MFKWFKSKEQKLLEKRDALLRDVPIQNNKTTPKYGVGSVVETERGKRVVHKVSEYERIEYLMEGVGTGARMWVDSLLPYINLDIKIIEGRKSCSHSYLVEFPDKTRKWIGEAWLEEGMTSNYDPSTEL